MMGLVYGPTGVAYAASDPSMPDQWAKQCNSTTLGLDEDTVQLAPVIREDKTPGGGDPRKPNGDGKWVPVIMIHGWTSSSTHTAANSGAFSSIIDLSSNPGYVPHIDRTLIGQLQRIPGAAVFTFDYHPYSARWVDDKHLGPALASVIDCLYKASGQKAIIVAHSMGGLIARYAATQPGAAGRDGAAEISTVVTFGTPETGSVAALLAGADYGAATNDVLAVVRALLSVCGTLASDTIETGTLCDWLPAAARAFESDAGIALRAGSAKLAALKPWPRGIYLDALAGNVTFEVPDAGWFALSWSTTDVDVGDVIVTPQSALAGATNTKNATCKYQLSPVRGATDQLGLLIGWNQSGQVAELPLRAFSSACLHTHLMRGLELTTEAISVVAEDINARGPVTANDLLTAPVPAVCMHQAGKLVDGVQPGIPARRGFMELSWLHGGTKAKVALLALGDLDGDGRGDAATLLDCNAGGVPWPQVIAFYAKGPTLLGWSYLTDYNLPGVAPQENARARRIIYERGGTIHIEWSTQEDGDAAATSSLDYSANLHLSGHRIVASDLVGVTEHETFNSFLDDLRHGNLAAAGNLAAPGVAADAGAQFTFFPSAATATPTCYGYTNLFAMPPISPHSSTRAARKK